MAKIRHSQASRDAVVAAIRAGATLTKAAALARVPLRTVQSWMAKGRASLDAWAEAVEELGADGEIPEPDELAVFALDAEEALGQRNLTWLRSLEAAEGSSWTRFAWLLERTTPDEFSLRDNIVRRLELIGAEGGPVRATGGTEISAVVAVLVAAGAAAAEDEHGGRSAIEEASPDAS